MIQMADLQEQLEGYLQAFESRNLGRCLEFFDDDGCIHFMNEVFSGKERIKTWHKERFAAQLRILGVKGMTIDGNTVRIRARVVSERIRTWPAKSLSVVVVSTFEGTKIKNVKFGLGAIQAA